MKSIKVGLLGVGNVGSGTFNVLQRNQEEIRRRAGRGIEVVAVSARNLERVKERTGG
jgi:homoserine dehydrogenase